MLTSISTTISAVNRSSAGSRQEFLGGGEPTAHTGKEDHHGLQSIHVGTPPKLLSSLSPYKSISTQTSLASSKLYPRINSFVQPMQAKGDSDERKTSDLDIEGELSLFSPVTNNNGFEGFSTPPLSNRISAFEEQHCLPLQYNNSLANSQGKDYQHNLYDKIDDASSRDAVVEKTVGQRQIKELLNMKLDKPVEMDMKTFHQIRKASIESPMPHRSSFHSPYRSSNSHPSKKVSFSPNLICILFNNP